MFTLRAATGFSRLRASVKKRRAFGRRQGMPRGDERGVNQFELLETRILLAGVVISELHNPRQLIVRLHADRAVDDAQLSALVGAEAKVSSSFPALGNLHTVRFDETINLDEALESVRSHPDVLYAEPDYRIQLTATPNDPQFGQLWGLNNTGQTGGTPDADIDAPEAWDATTGSHDTIVAVIDTGVDYLHEDLAANIWVNEYEIAGDGEDNDGNGYVDDVHGYDFFNDDPDPMDDHNHGTHVAGTIGAVGNNGIGVTGVNWNVKIMALKFLDASGSGETSDAIAAIDYAVANGATISNNSWGFSDGFSQALYDAIAAAGAQDHLVLAAAGNGNFIGFGQNNDDTPFYPASYDLDNIISVAALDHNNDRAIFSNYGSQSVDLGAPGVDILSTFRNDTYGSISGTSMATPHVAGVAALVRDHNPDWTYPQVIGQLFNTSDPVNSLQGITTTGGRVNAFAALVPDTFGPRVLATEPSQPIAEPLATIRVTFDEAIQGSTFTVEDIVSLTGPNGPIAVNDVVPVAGTLDRSFEVQFPEQVDVGQYELVIGPNIEDANGNLMDQDDDDINGEPVEDQYRATVSVVLFLGKYDFGPSGAPVAAGFEAVAPSKLYPNSDGFGFQTSGVAAADRASGTALERDLVYDHDLTFIVDVPNAVYRVSVISGDQYNIAHDQMAVHLEGEQVDTIDTPGEQVVTTIYDDVLVNDGQLTFRMEDLGGADPNVVLNGLIVQWLSEEQSGPRVVALDRDGDNSESLESLSIHFSEPINPATFDLTDVVALTGPLGAITPSSLTSIDEASFELGFPQQTAAGEYEIVLGPEIEDLSGNLMDQDQDGVTGEPTEDRYVGSVLVVPIPDQQFDFGSSSSPVETGFVAVHPGSSYTIQQGYGFQAGNVKSTDRGSGSDLERDLVYAHDLTFTVDLPNAIYRVALHTGDRFNITHDQMAVFLENVQVDTITSPGQQIVTSIYEGVVVDDGQLTLRLQDQGGSDVNAVLNGLVIQWTGDEQSGPRVVELARNGTTSDPLESLLVSFNEPINAETFGLEDIAALAGPAGPITPDSLISLSSTEFEIGFATQTATGVYSLTLGPEIEDFTGNAMDQDQDGTIGEAVEDQFSGEVVLVPIQDQRFDFGSPNSPVEAGFVGVTASTSYDVVQGYGFQQGNVKSTDRGSGSALERDLVYAQDLTFAVDLPNAAYRVKLFAGDRFNIAHDQMAVFLEGVQVGTIDSPPQQIVETVFEEVVIDDGQLTLRMQDLGGADANVVLNGLEIQWVGSEQSGPRVLELTRGGAAPDPLDRLRIRFNESIDASTFTLDDVESVTGPDGPITPNGVIAVADDTFELLIPPQTTVGSYLLVLGPQIQDVSGNPMDQDSDGVAGEPLEDQFEGSVTLVAVPDQLFDFGSSNSPIEAGFVGVSQATLYSSELGYGFQAGSIRSTDRGSGTHLERDLVYARSLTFAIDLPNAIYQVTLFTGDRFNIVHDQMAVFLEGSQVDTLDSPGTQVVETVYQDVSVADGQLTLTMQDLGGADVNVVLNGMIVQWQAAIPPATSVVTASTSPAILSIPSFYVGSGARDRESKDSSTKVALISRGSQSEQVVVARSRGGRPQSNHSGTGGTLASIADTARRLSDRALMSVLDDLECRLIT